MAKHLFYYLINVKNPTKDALIYMLSTCSKANDVANIQKGWFNLPLHINLIKFITVDTLKKTLLLIKAALC